MWHMAAKAEVIAGDSISTNLVNHKLRVSYTYIAAPSIPFSLT